MWYQRIYRAFLDPHVQFEKTRQYSTCQKIRPCYACSINAQGETPYILVNSSPAIKNPTTSNIGAMGKKKWKTKSMFGQQNLVTQFPSLNFYHSSLITHHSIFHIRLPSSLTIFHTIWRAHVCHGAAFFFPLAASSFFFFLLGWLFGLGFFFFFFTKFGESRY